MRWLLKCAAVGACSLLIGLAGLAPTNPAMTTHARAADKPADLKAYKEIVPGSEVKFEMIPIPGGTFQMGSPETEAGRSPDEGPQHPVTIGPFWMGKCEVTWDEYDI